MIKLAFHSLVFILLTVVTQLGGLAWIAALCVRRRVLAFGAVYIALSVAALWVAPIYGRVPLACLSGGNLQMQSVMYCALNRQYVVPELRDVLIDYANDMDDAFPAGTETRVLDANFPFLTGFPLLPHLSHDDGRKVDIAFYYKDDSGYLPKATRSPIGYFAFEQGPTDCPKVGASLRWDMSWMQPLWPDYPLEEGRMAKALQLLSADDRVDKLFIEPHLKSRFDAQSSKVRFQGCRAARHDDHIHFQLK